MIRTLIAFLLITKLFSQESDISEPIKTPEQIQEELNADEALFKKAKEMFNPWYTGPLITGGSGMMPPGYANVSPYLFVNTNYGRYQADRSTLDTPNLVNVNPVFPIAAGITKWMDGLLILQGNANWIQNESDGGFGDIKLQLGFPIYKETMYVPGIKFLIAETFPTGKYENLDPSKLGTDGIGAGSFQTTFGLNFGKVIFWSYQHPMSLRMQFSYVIPKTVHVENFSVYGGGFGTKGKVRPGNGFTAGFGVEYSITQRWVIANDILYTTQARSKFYGDLGTGLSAGGPSNDQLSLAPAIEYNWNPNLGIIAGTWFTVYGRNSAEFISAVASITYTFPIKKKQKPDES